MLLDALEARDINNAAIMMGNAKYHKTLPERTAKMSRKKQQLIEYCCLKNILTHENDMKSVLWGKVKSFIQ